MSSRQHTEWSARSWEPRERHLIVHASAIGGSHGSDRSLDRGSRQDGFVRCAGDIVVDDGSVDTLDDGESAQRKEEAARKHLGV